MSSALKIPAIKNEAADSLAVEDGARHHLAMAPAEADRGESDEVLRIVQERLADALALARLGTWHVIFGQDESRDEWTVSPELRHIYGYSETTAIGTGAGIAVIPPEDQELVRGYWASAKRGQGPSEWEHRIQVAGGTRWMHVAARIKFDAQGRAVEASGTSQDITERKLAEMELVTLREEMRQMLDWQVARHTVAALAHELNQPLFSLSALCEAALRMRRDEGRDPDGSDTLAQALRHMATESERAGAAVRRLMASIRQPDVKLESVALPELLSQAVQVGRTGGCGECQVILDWGDDLPRVRLNRVQMEKVILNLMGNAMEAMREIGHPRPRIWVEANLVAGGSEVLVSIRDEGPGIPATREREIFHPFVSGKPGGLGMGLVISRALVEAQGGRLWLEPSVATGACFQFTLPIA